MDELDRMYRRLAHNIRASFPDLLTRPFEVSQIYQHVIPYRLNRRELALDSNEEYELTLMQLLSGARGLLTGDEDMQRALRAELESANPDLTAFRAFATSTVSLSPDALRAMDAQPLARRASPAPPAADKAVASAQLELSRRATEEVAVAEMRPERPEPTPPAPRVSPPTSPAGGVAPTSSCRYCGGELPDGREVNFCPHCGQNLTIKQCPACSTELELEWRFCVACGRQVE
jgi:hypothetical protein